jgi:cytoskeleton protein RodZ
MTRKPRPTRGNGGNLDSPSLSLRTTPEDTNLPLKIAGYELRTERERSGTERTAQHSQIGLDSLGFSLRATLEDTNLPAKTVGQELRTERERRGIKLDDVSRTLKIRPSYLVAIEESRFEDLPGRGFTIGYVGRYARHLRLDVGKLVDRVEAEFAARDEARNRPLEIVPFPSRAFRLGAKLVGAALLLAALTYYSDDVVPWATQAYEQATEAVPAQIAGPSPTVAPAEQPVASAAPESLLPMETEIAVTPAASPPDVPAQGLQARLPTGRQYGLRNRVSRITLRVHRTTSVEVRGARNRDFLDRRLEPGDTYRVPNVGNLRLSAGDAGAVEIILDGVSVGFVGEQGTAARGLSLHPQAIVDRQRRR